LTGAPPSLAGGVQLNTALRTAGVAVGESGVSGVVRGTVLGRDGREIEQPVVVVKKSGHPYAWVLGAHGSYEIRLPTGEYTLYATARNHSQTAAVAVALAAGSEQRRDFQGLEAPGHIRFDVRDTGDGRALDARITITKGQQPLVEFLGRKTFFTELEPRGRLDLEIAPGPYEFEVSTGGGFTAPAQTLPLQVEPGRRRTARGCSRATPGTWAGNSRSRPRRRTR